ncbi:hypothetical protein GCM10008967_20050 [Bacillus carboniphilus]|uniref:DUF3231 family protein n=1 Tax=Bacillus carboniphilus TaxID=86663 RepID=A0ABN0W946_9BACI
MSSLNDTSSNQQLTSAEVGKLWASYMGNTMGSCVLRYFYQHVDDGDIKEVIKTAYHLSREFIDRITAILKKENHPIPVGFTEKDVNLKAPRLFMDEFYLHYLKYIAKAGMSLYAIAVPLMTRKETKELFTHCVKATTDLMNLVNNVLLKKGYLTKPPFIPIPNQVDFVKKQTYLSGFFGDVRPAHALEIAHNFDNLENNVTSKALLVGFVQVSQDRKVKDALIRGKELTEKHLEIFSEQLHRDNLPSHPRLDHLVTSSIIPPFSDKLMISHKIDMFSMKIRGYGNAASLNGRHDIGLNNAKALMDVSRYVQDLANIVIDKGWMEQMPQAVKRDELGYRK